MKKVQISDLHLWQFEGLSKEASIRHFVTDRSSYPAGREFTLSFSSSPNKEEVQSNRRMLATAMGIDDAQLYFPSQVHKTKIVTVTRHTSKEDLMETDSLITNETGVCIAVMSADCVPILLVDMKNKAIGAVHSGWRGTVARILEKTLLKMKSTFGTSPEHLLAAIGPSVSHDAYEVGDEVVEAVNQTFGANNDLMTTQGNGKAKLDLWKANVLQLREFGVDQSQIEISGMCTVHTNQHFFSARKGDAGRFAAGIMLV